MTTIRISSWTKNKLETLKSREEHSSIDSVVKSLLNKREILRTKRSSKIKRGPSSLEKFTMLLRRNDGLEPHNSQKVANTAGEKTEIVSTLLLFRCTECGNLNLLESDFRSVSSKERDMGKETQHVSSFQHPCGNCGTKIEAELEGWEYPRNSIEHWELDVKKNAIYEDGIERIFETIKT